MVAIDMIFWPNPEADLWSVNSEDPGLSRLQVSQQFILFSIFKAQVLVF